MDLNEEAVMYWLAANGETFLVPQFDIREAGSQPDFVAIRPAKKTVYVVEVASGGNLRGLVERVREREKRWLSPLRKMLVKSGTVSSRWRYEILLFVRRDQRSWIEKKIGNHASIKFLCLEDAYAHWRWDPRVWTSSYLFDSDALNHSSSS